MTNNKYMRFYPPTSIAKGFKEKWSELKKYTDKQVAGALILDEIGRMLDQGYFDVKYYKDEDKDEIITKIKKYFRLTK